MIVRDEDTRESWDIPPTKEGYAEAAAKIQSIVERGHRIGDDNSGTISKVDEYFNGNLFRTKMSFF